MHKLLRWTNTFSQRPHHLKLATRIYILRVMHIKMYAWLAAVFYILSVRLFLYRVTYCTINTAVEWAYFFYITDIKASHTGKIKGMGQICEAKYNTFQNEYNVYNLFIYCFMENTSKTTKEQSQVGKIAVQKHEICYDAFSIYNLLCRIISTKSFCK